MPQHTLSYLDSNNQYHKVVFGYKDENDLTYKIAKYSKSNSISVPERPDDRYSWNGSDWFLPLDIVKKEYENAVQIYMEEKAHEYGYDSLMSAISYAEETIVTKYAIEGKAFRKWRSLVWDTCYKVLTDVQNGLRQPPEDVNSLIQELPKLEDQF